MSLERDCASLFIVGLPGLTPDPEVLKLIDDGVGGVILFKRNVESPAQLAGLVRSLKTHAGRPLMASVVMVAVIRLTLPAWTAQMTPLAATSWLVAGVVIGVSVYLFSMLFLWYAAGRPDGTERVVLDQGFVQFRNRFRAARPERI